MTPEKEVQNAIIANLKKMVDQGKPIWFERRQAGGFSYKKGIPDLYGVANGIHFEIEVKKPGGKTTPLQDKFANRIEKCGAIYILADNAEIVTLTLNQLF